MQYWSIEVYQIESGSWIGVVKRRPGRPSVQYVTDHYCTATFAFTDCNTWVQARECLEQETRRNGTESGL